jgi:hypothetical protein
MKAPRTLTSINGLHDAGRSERKSIAFDMGIVFIGGMTLYLMLVAMLMGPAWLAAGEGSLALRLFEVFSILALDPSSMGQFVALAGVVLALNRFDRRSPDELGMETAVKLWTRLDFRSLVQFILTLVAATAPYRAVTWIVHHTGNSGWSQQAAASIGTCVILWLLLLLAGPTGTVFWLVSLRS